MARKHKHDWRFVSATYSEQMGLQKGKKRCRGCGAEKVVD